MDNDKIALRVDADAEWYRDFTEVSATMHLLLRAGVLRDETIDDYLQKPWNWSKERATCRTIERFMADNGVDARRGWQMTMRDVVLEGMKP